MLQNDRVPLSTVYQTWITLEAKFSNIELPEALLHFVKGRIDDRWKQLL
jgi:hypothetical protein